MSIFSILLIADENKGEKITYNPHKEEYSPVFENFSFRQLRRPTT